MNKIQQTKKGFTIIEVVLVLAIAGLIFMMVFLALPALQRSQRDTQRKNDASRLLAAVNDYRAANRGAVPKSTEVSKFVSNYVTVSTGTGSSASSKSTFDDPSTLKRYTVNIKEGVQNGKLVAGNMEIVTNSA